MLLFVKGHENSFVGVEVICALLYFQDFKLISKICDEYVLLRVIQPVSLTHNFEHVVGADASEDVHNHPILQPRRSLEGDPLEEVVQEYQMIWIAKAEFLSFFLDLRLGLSSNLV